MSSAISSIDNVNTSTVGGKDTLILYELAIAFLPLTIITVSLRMYVRTIIVRAFGWDDGILLASLAFFIVFCSFVIKLVNLENDPATLEKFASGEQGALEVINAAYTSGLCFIVFYSLSVVAIKLSLAVFFLRIVVRQWQRALIITATTVFTTFGLANAFVYLFQCGSDIDNEIPAEMAGKCLPLQSLLILTYVYGALDAATDATFALLPVALLWNSNMPRAMKLSSGLLLAMGSVSCICAVIRVACLPSLGDTEAFTKEAVNTGKLSVVEPGLGLIATSLAACRPLWKKVFEASSVSSFLRWSSRKTTSGSSRSFSGKHSSKQGPLSFVEKSEGLKGFERFNDAEYGLTTTIVMADGSKSETSTELQDLGSLEARGDRYTQEDKSSMSLVRQSRSSSDEHLRAGIPVTRTYDVSIDVRDESR